jgi:hypothetical protein
MARFEGSDACAVPGRADRVEASRSISMGCSRSFASEDLDDRATKERERRFTDLTSGGEVWERFAAQKRNAMTQVRSKKGDSGLRLCAGRAHERLSGGVLVKRFFMFLAFAAASALVVAQFAVAGGNQLLAKGTVTENAGTFNKGDWTISFNIHARGDGQSSQVDVTPAVGAPTASGPYSFDGSVCAGSYVDPTFGGTDVFVIGELISGTGLDGVDYQLFVIHEGGPLGADRSALGAFPNLAVAQGFCTTVTHASPFFPIVAATGLLFKV